MKKFISLISLVSITIISCSSNESDDKTKDIILGTWLHVETFEGEVERELSKCDKLDTLEFLENDTFDFSYHSFDSNNDCFLEGHELGVWVKSGDDLVLTYNEDFDPDGNVENYTILELSESKLRIRLNFEGGIYEILVFNKV